MAGERCEVGVSGTSFRLLEICVAVAMLFIRAVKMMKMEES